MASPTSSSNDNTASADRYASRQSPSRFKRRHLFGRSQQRIAPQSTATMQSSSESPPPQTQQQQQPLHYQKGHFGQQHHSLRPSAWTIPVATQEDEEEEERPATLISDDDSAESLPFQPDSQYDVPLITPDRSTPLKSNVQTTQPTTQPSSRKKHQVQYTRSLHNSHRKKTLHHITPRRRPNVMVVTSLDTSATATDNSFMYQQQHPHGHRGNGVVLDLTSLFSPADHHPPQSPSNTATTAASANLHHHPNDRFPTTPKYSNGNANANANSSTYNAPPWKQHQQLRSANTSAAVMTPHSPSTVQSHHDLQWDTKSQTTQEALNTERQSQALTQWLNFVLVGEQQQQQLQGTLQEQQQDRSTTRKKARRQRSFDGMSVANRSDDGQQSTAFSRATTPTSKGRSGTPTRAVASAPSISSERTTPTNNTTPHDHHHNDTTVVVHSGGKRRQKHRRLSLFQYGQSFEHAHDQAHHWFHHSAQWKELRVRIRCEVGGGKMTLREDRDLYANIGCRELLLDMFLSYRPAWLTMALEVVMNESILPSHHGQGNQHHELGQSNIPTPKQLKQFIVHRVLSDAKVLSKYTQGHGASTPSGKFEQQYHDELRPLVLYRILVLVFFLDRAAVKFQALKTHNNNLGNLFHAKSKTNLKSTQQVLVMFCREFLSRQGDIIKQLSRVNLQVHYRQGPLDEIDYPIVNFAIDLRDGVRLCRLLELLWLLPRQHTFYAKSANNGKAGVDITAKYPLLSQLRIPAISRLQKIHNVSVALAALQDDCHIGLPQDLQAHHIVDGQRRMVLRLVWTIVLMHCFDSHEKVLTTEQLESEIAQVHALRNHNRVMQKRQRRRKNQQDDLHSSLILLEQETDAVESVPLMHVDEPMSPLTKATPKVLRPSRLPTLSLNISRSSSFDGDQSFSSDMQLEESPVVQQWKGLLHQWCQEVCMLVEDLEIAESVRTGSTPIEKSFPGQWTAEDLNNGKTLCCLIHHYHPTLLTLDDLRLSSTVIDGPPTKIQTTPTGHFPFTQQQQESPKIAPDYYMRLAQRRLVEIGGIPPMMLVPLAADSNKSPRRKQLPVVPLEDEKSIVVFLYHVCARLLESRHQVNAVIFVQQRYRYLRCVSLFRQKKEAAKVIWATWRNNKHTYYQARSQKYGKSVRVIEVFVAQHFDKLLLLQQIRVERELQNVAVTPIQAQVRRLLALKHCRELRGQHAAAVIIQTRYRQYHDYLSYQLMLLEMLPAVTTIQRHWRGFTQRWRYNFIIDTTIVLQSFVRGAVLVRKGKGPWRNSATCIQRIWRGFCVQLQYQMDLLDIVLVQCLFRKHQATSLAKRRYDAVFVLQRMSRGLLARLRCIRLRRAIAAAIHIQRTSRRYLSIQEANRLRTERARYHASLVIQRFWRRVAFLRERRLAATKIQTQWRTWFGRREYRLMKSASVKAQSFWRRCVQRKAYLTLLADIILIQATFRRWLYGVVRTSERKRAVLTVQKYGRRFLAERLLSRKKLHRELMIKMAIVCQAFARRNSCTRNWTKTRRAVLTIQSKWRGFRRFRISQRRQQLLDALETCGLLYRHAQKGSFKIVPHTRQVLQLSKQSKLRCGRKRIVLSNDLTLVPPWRGHRQKLFWHRSHVKAMRWKFTSGARLRDLPRRKISIVALRQINEAASRLQAPWVYYIQRGLAARDGADKPQPKRTAIVRGFENRRFSRAKRSILVSVQSLIMRGFNAEDEIVRLSSEGAALRLDRATTVLACQPKLQQRREDVNIERVLNLLRRNIRVSLAKQQNSTLQNLFDPFREILLGAERESALTAETFAFPSVGRGAITKEETSRQDPLRATSDTGLAGIDSHKGKAQAAPSLQVSQTANTSLKGINSHKGKAQGAPPVQVSQTCDAVLSGIDSNQGTAQGAPSLQVSQTSNTGLSGIDSNQGTAQGAQAIPVSQELEKEHKVAAVCIQRFVRGFLARQQLSLQHFAATEIQKTWRCYENTAGYIYVVVSAIKMQSFFRMAKAKKVRWELWRQIWGIHHSAVKIQSFYRMLAAKKLARHRALDAREQKRLMKALSRKNAAVVIQKAVREKKRASGPIFHRRLSLSQGMIRGWIARKQSNPEVQKSIVLIKEAEVRSKLHPSMRLGARMERALKILKSSSSLTEIMNIVCTIELATRFSKECCEEFVDADATETLVALLFSCNKSLPHVELLYYLMCTLLNVCKHESLIQRIATVETAEAFLYLVRMYGSEDAVFCSAVALLELCILHNENVQALVAAPACKRRMEGVYKQWDRKLQRRLEQEAPAQGFFTPQFLVKRGANKAKTDMLILGISYDLEKGVSMLEHILLRTL